MAAAARRVVVTGCGVVSSIGTGWTAFREALRDGRSGVGPITLFEPRPGCPRLAAEVRDFHARDHLAPAQYRRMNRLSQMTVAACGLALTTSGLRIDEKNRDRVGIVYGTAEGGIVPAAEMLSEMIDKGPKFVNPISFPNTVMNAPPGYASIVFGIRGPNSTVNHKETSAEMALGLALDWLGAGRADALLAGGSDESCVLLYEALLGFRALSGRNGAEEASRPFDRRRNGLVMGEGAAFLLLETIEHARARGAGILAELAGFGFASGAAPPNGYGTDPAPIAAAMRGAMADAGIGVAEVAAVYAAANSTVPLDRIEGEAIEQVFGAGRGGPRVIAIRGAIGSFGAAGAFGAAAAVGTLQGDPFYPTLGLAEPEFDLNFREPVPNGAPPPRAVLVNGVATGGACATLAFRRFDEVPS